MRKEDYVKASEIDEYVYCKRGWWLRFNGYISRQSPQMAYGVVQHDLLTKQLASFSLLKKIVLSILLINSTIFLILLMYFLIFKL